MTPIVQELEALLARWETANAADVDQLIADRLQHYDRTLSPPGTDPAHPLPHVTLAAGGIVWKPHTSERRMALIHRPRYDDWCLPKGKVDPGEMLSETARREVWEETGCDVEFIRAAGILHYRVRTGPKFVFYWEMRATQVHPLPAITEVDQLQWLAPRAALHRLSYDIERQFLRRVEAHHA
ncbi:MAG: NUDIX hydrolase [Verrucomicrobia bacterium]|nr:NUDIX hydrolase [Verrucomicrobiota bacterium]